MNEYDETMDPDLVSISDETLLALLQRMARLTAREHHRHGHGHHAQRHILGLLRERGAMNQRDLLDMLHVRSASLSEVLAKLERGGLIARSRDDQDRRSHIVRLTGQGGDAASGQGEEVRQRAAAILEPLNPEERQQLGRLLIKLIVALEEGEAARREQSCGGCGRHGHGRHGGYGPGEESGPECGQGRFHERGHGRRGGHGPGEEPGPGHGQGRGQRGFGRGQGRP